MPEWNLSVRLTGQGSNLAATLRSSAREADRLTQSVTEARRALTALRTDAARGINVRLDVDAGHLRSDVTTALRGAGAGQGLSVRLDVDADHLHTEVQQALNEARAGSQITIPLGVDAQNLSWTANRATASLDGLRDQARQTAHALNVLQRAAREAGNQLEELREEARGAATSIRSVGTAADRSANRLTTLSTGTRTLRTDLDELNVSLTTVGESLGGIRGRVGGLTQSNGRASMSVRSLLLALSGLATAAVPLTAGLGASVAPLVGQFAAGGAAATAFGVALAGQIEPLTEAADAEKKYQDAVREHGRSSAEAMQAQLKYQQILASLPPEAQQAAIALSQLKQNFSDWSDDMAGFTMEPVTKGITVLDELIPRMTPHVKLFSRELDRVVTIAGGAIETPGFDAMADRFADFTDRQLDEMTDGVMHFLRLLSEGEGVTDGPMAEFIAFARENGPEAREALSAISDAVVTLLQSAAEAGPTMLTLVTAVARLVAALPPELVGIIIQVATALKLLQLSGAGMAALAAGLGRVRTQIAAVGTTSAAAGGGIAGLRAAFLALGTAAKASVVLAGIGALVYVLMELSDIGQEAPPDVDKLTSSLRQLGQTGKVTGEAARVFGKDLGDLHEKVRALTDPSAVDDIQQWIVTLGGLGDWDSTPVKKAKEDLDAVDKALAGLVKNGQADLAAEALKRLTAEYGKGGRDTSQFTNQLDDYESAVADVKFEQELAAASMGIFGQAALDTQVKLDAQKQSADGLRQSIIALNEVNRSAYDAQINFEAALDNLTESFKEHGNTLNLDTEAGRANAQAMSQAAAAQDELIATGLAAGESFESMAGKSDRLRESMLTLATQAFDGNRQKAQEYVNTLLGTPGEVKTMIRLEREEAVRGLQAVQAEIDKTPGAKRVVVSTLNAAAIAALEAVGLKTEQLPDGRTAVFTANGEALGSIGAVQDALSRVDGRTANATVTVTHRTVFETVGSAPATTADLLNQQARRFEANGGVVDFYAAGGIRPGGPRSFKMFASGGENHVAQIARPGDWRVWAEPETGGEAYIPFARSKRVRSRAIAEETILRLGGDPASIQWNANGSVTDWRYDPVTGSLYSSSDITAAGKKTKKVKVRGKNGKLTTKEVDYFDLGAVEQKLKAASKATQAWNKNLEKVADRVGGDVAEALASMGEDGMKLAEKMAKGSTKYINEMAKALRDLQKTAKASLTDYTRQMGEANKVNSEFSKDLAQLAAQGYGDLASQLAAQGDEAAMQLADSAAKDKGKARAANEQAKRANSQLTGEEQADLIQIIAAIKNKNTGIHAVAAATGLGEDVIIDVANKAKVQIMQFLGGRAERFLSDLFKANKGMAYADGGIRAGLYGTRGGIIRFAEPSTRGEAYIPLSPSKRSSATAVLSNVASRFGLGLTDGQGQRVVIIREQGPLVGESHFHISGRAADQDLARAVEARQAYQLRRLARGGVGAR